MPRRKKRFIDKKKALVFDVVQRSQLDPLSADPSATPFVLQPKNWHRLQDDLDHRQLAQGLGASVEDHETGAVKIINSIPADLLQVAEELDDMRESYYSADFASDTTGAHLEIEDPSRNPYLRSIQGEAFQMAPAKGEEKARVRQLNTALEARAHSQERKTEEEVFRELGIDLSSVAPDKFLGLQPRARPREAKAPPGAQPSQAATHTVQLPSLTSEELPSDCLQALYDDDAEEDKWENLDDDFVALAMSSLDPVDEQTDGAGGGAGAGGDEHKHMEDRSHDFDGEFDEYEYDEDQDEEDDGEYRRAPPEWDPERDPDAAQREQRLIDEHFDRVLGEYDEERLGDLQDEPEVLGTVMDMSEYKGVMDDFLNRRDKNYQPSKDIPGVDVDTKTAHEVTAKGLQRLAQTEEPDPDAAIDKMFAPRERNPWDAQSVLSTYSNLYNHPAVIPAPRLDKEKHIKLSRKSGMPLGVLPERGQGREAEYDEEEEMGGGVNQGVKRPKKETKEQKRARKRAVKLARQQTRERKKNMRQEYSKQGAQLHKEAVSQALHNPPALRNL